LRPHYQQPDLHQLQVLEDRLAVVELVELVRLLKRL
jgi:hypothetical protein